MTSIQAFADAVPIGFEAAAHAGKIVHTIAREMSSAIGKVEWTTWSDVIALF